MAFSLSDLVTSDTGDYIDTEGSDRLLLWITNDPFTASLSFSGSFTTAARQTFTKLLTAALSFSGNLTTAAHHFYLSSLTAALSFTGAISRNLIYGKRLSAALKFTAHLVRLRFPIHLVLKSTLRFQATVATGWGQLTAYFVVLMDTLSQIIKAYVNHQSKSADIRSFQQSIGPATTLLDLSDLSGRPLSTLFIKNLSTTVLVEIDSSISFNRFPQFIPPQSGIYLSPATGLSIYARSDTFAVDIEIIAGI